MNNRFKVENDLSFLMYNKPYYTLKEPSRLLLDSLITYVSNNAGCFDEGLVERVRQNAFTEAYDEGFQDGYEEAEEDLDRVGIS